MAIPSKTASEVINALRPVVPQMDLQHLRRLARPAYLPPAVVATLPPRDFPPDMSILYLLICATSKARPQDIIKLAGWGPNGFPRLYTVGQSLVVHSSACWGDVGTFAGTLMMASFGTGGR